MGTPGWQWWPPSHTVNGSNDSYRWKPVEDDEDEEAEEE